MAASAASSRNIKAILRTVRSREPALTLRIERIREDRASLICFQRWSLIVREERWRRRPPGI